MVIDKINKSTLQIGSLVILLHLILYFCMPIVVHQPDFISKDLIRERRKW